MTPEDDYMRALLTKLNPVRDEDLASLSHTAAAEALFREVVSMHEPEKKRSTRLDLVPTQGEAFCQWHRFKKPAGDGRRRFGARRLIPAILTLALLLGGGTAGFWALHALGARDSKRAIVIGDQTQPGASSTTPGTGLLANPYPLAMSMTTQTTAPGPSETAAPPSDPTWRESAWAKDLGKAIMERYLGEDWMLVDAFESLLPSPQMVIEIVPRTGNASLGSGHAPNAYVQVIVQRADDQANAIASTTTAVVTGDEQAGAHATTTLAFEPDGQADTGAFTPPPPTTPFGRDNQGGALASTTTLVMPFKLDGSFLAASVQRADHLEIDVTARVLTAEAEPYKPPLDGTGAKKLADFVSSIIELAAGAAK